MTNDTRDRLQDTARAIEAHLPPGTGFILLTFDFGNADDPRRRLEYISNAKREDALKTMQEYIDKCTPDRWMKHLDEPPDLTKP